MSAIAPGTKVTREILDALPDGSVVLTYTTGWTKIGPNDWASPLAHFGEAKYMVTDQFERVALTVLWDATEYYERSGYCAVSGDTGGNDE
jgi:hypothetical protein